MQHKLDNKEEFQQKIKDFSQSEKWKNLLIFLVFVALAFIFWLLQYYQQEFDTEIAMPVKYDNIPEEIVLSGGLPERINLKAFGKGTTLLKYSYRKRKEPLFVDLSGLVSDRSSYTIDHPELKNLIQNDLENTITLKSFTPEKITVLYSPLANKDIPIRFNGSLEPAAGFIFTDSITIDPPFVSSLGEQSELDSIPFIETIWFEKKNINKNLEITIGLDLPKNIRVAQKEVRVSIKTEEFTEKTFNIPIKISNAPNNYTVRLFPSSVEIMVQVGLSQYAQLEKSDFEINIDYQELTKSQSGSFSVFLTKEPDNIINYRIMPEIVQFLIEQAN